MIKTDFKNTARIFITLFLILLINGCSALFFQKNRSYIKVNGLHFELNGRPYYFLGTNLWYGCYLGSTGETGDRERLIKELDLLQALGITNLRVLAASEKSEIKNSLKPAIQNAPGEYDENLLEGLDFLLNEMGKRKMYAVVFLNNYWEWSGGMAQYNAWFPDSSSNGTGEVADPENPKFGWGEFMRISATFYTNEKANAQFREFIRMIVTRKNKFSGYYYYEDPSIMAWQLANEPRPWGTPDQVENYYHWIDSTASFIHSIDPNHLVTTGNEGTMGSLGSEEYYLKAHKSRYIDYLTFHLWAKNWGWFDAKKIAETYQSTESKAADYLNLHFKFARLLNKPLTLEEFGMARDSEIYIPGYPSTARDHYFQTVFQLVYDSASAGAAISGTNFWTWGGFGRAKNSDFKWRKGDPFLGDPPQEAQGLNSVFDADSSTLKILKRYSYLMNNLGQDISFQNN